MFKCHFYSTLYDGAELQNYLTEKEARYHKIFANRYDSQKLQRVIDTQINISEADNSVESSLSLSHSFQKKKSLVLSCIIRRSFIIEYLCCWFLSCLKESSSC